MKTIGLWRWLGKPLRAFIDPPLLECPRCGKKTLTMMISPVVGRTSDDDPGARGTLRSSERCSSCGYVYG